MYSIHPTSLAYNIQIRRFFSVARLLNLPEHIDWIATGIPYYFSRERTIFDESVQNCIYEKRKGGGAVFNIRAIPNKHWWFDVTTALAKETTRAIGGQTFSASRFGIDDLVFAGGHNWFLSERLQFDFYVIGGIPIERTIHKEELFDTLIGTRFYSLGFGYEISYAILKEESSHWLVVLFQNRFLHFFDRAFDPVLPIDAKMRPGNKIDLLFTLQFRKNRHIGEMGYNPTFFTHRAHVFKDYIEKSPHLAEHSVYATYSIIIDSFPIMHHPVIMGPGFIYSRGTRDHIKNLDLFFNLSVYF